MPPKSKTILRQAISRFDTRKKDVDRLIPAVLGFMINGIKTVEVADRPGYVYARIRSNLNEMVQVINDRVSPVYDLPVLLIRDPNNITHYRIDSRDIARYETWGGTSSYLPRHGNQHSFNIDQGGGGDIVWVYGRQFVPLSLSPSGTSGGPNVLLNGYSYYQNFEWKYAGGTGTSSLLPFKPTGSNARMVLVYLDDFGNPQLLGGSTYFNASITGVSAIIPYLPLLPTSKSIPIGGIRLVSGTDVILWDNIYDLRPIIVGDGFIPTGTFGHTIEDDGSALPARASLNFVGNGFVVYDGAGKTNVSGTSLSHFLIYDDSVFKASGTAISFDSNLLVVVSGTVAFVSATAGGGGGGALAVYENNAFKVSGTALIFNDDTTVKVSGSFAHLEPAYWRKPILEDEFTNTDDNLGWSNTAGSLSQISPSGLLDPANHIGVCRLTSTSPGAGRITLGNTVAVIDVASLEYMGWVVRGDNTFTTETGTYRVGIMTNPAATERSDSTGVYFLFDSQVTGSWSLVANFVGSKTITPLTTTYTSGNWYLFELRRNGNNFDVYVNNVFKTTITSNIPDAGTAHLVVADCMKYVASSIRLDLDWFGLKAKPMTQRWT